MPRRIQTCPVHRVLKAHVGTGEENGGEEAIPGEYAGADGGVDQRMSVVSSKMGRQAKRHGDLSTSFEFQN